MTADLDARALARKRLDVNIVVEAGAGTGKTTLLTDRLLFLLLAGGPEREGLSISRVVALTFTDKAAGEIKARLAERLGDLLSVLDGRALPPERRALMESWLREAREDFGATDERLRTTARDALRDLDRAPIGTIHAFCRTLLQLHPVEAGLNPGARVDEGTGFDDVFEAEWARWLESALAADAPASGDWDDLLPRVSLADLKAVARETAARDTPAGGNAWAAERLVRLRAAVEALAVGQPRPVRGKIQESLDRVAERLRVLEGVVRDPLGPLPPEVPWEESDKKWPATWDPAGEAVYHEALGLVNAVSPLGEALLARARRLLEPFVAACRARYRAAGWIGFDDLLRGARDLLLNHPEARRELKARYAALLVDEFQDTDPLQGETLLLLAEGPEGEASHWRDVVLAPGRLFIVGDPKQSIYRFRGADIRAYEAFVALVLSQGGARCDLSRSFRTHAGIVEPVNRLFEDLMRESPGLQPPYRPLLPRPGDGNGAVELAVLRGGAGDADDRRAAEARWIAGWITDHCGPAGEGRPWRWGDVALLFRSASPLTVYMEALKAARVPYRVESDRDFYRTPEVIDFLNLLRVIDDPSDRVSLIGLLRSPLAMLADRDLMELAAAGALDFRRDAPAGLPPATRERLRSFYDRLARLRAAARGDTPPEAVARLLRETLLLPIAAAFYHGEQSVANLLKLTRLASESHRERGETLGAFARRLSEAVGRGVEEGESPLGEEQVDAVRLSTIHKSKGLEYKVVLLPNLAAPVQNGDRRPAALRRDWAEGKVGRRFLDRRWPDAAMVFLEADETKREEQEAVRLFYVAATRAREHVVLVGQEKPALGSFQRMLESGSRPAENGLALKDGRVIPVRSVDRDETPARTAAARPPAGRRKASAAHARAWAARRAAAVGDGPALFQKPSARSGDDVQKNITGERPAGPTPENAALLGRLCHAVLERGPLAPVDLTARVDDAARRLRAEYPDTAWDVLSGEAEGLLDAFLRGPAAAALNQSEILGREVPFLFAREGTVVRGVIDLLCRWEGRLCVIDYKTDRLSPGEEPDRAAAYAAQGADYREAVRRSLGEPCSFDVLFLRTGRRVPVGDLP